MPSQKDKQCLDCGSVIHKKSTRCKECRVKALSAAITAQAEAIKAHEYNANLPAESIHIECIANNTVLITAYQQERSTQMRYNQDKLMSILDRITTITSYILDPMTYDSKQKTDKITINRNTRVIHSARVI